jgi:hypothetical protein
MWFWARALHRGLGLIRRETASASNVAPRQRLHHVMVVVIAMAMTKAVVGARTTQAISAAMLTTIRDPGI